jgi:heterotetrameric sarcosine oxidase delta subunit
VSLLVDCPFCGERPFGGELRAVSSADPGSDFERVYLPINTAGVQQERWFHALGCRRWLTASRDTTTNRFEA